MPIDHRLNDSLLGALVQILGQFNLNAIRTRLKLKSIAHIPAGLAGGRPSEYMHLVSEPLPAKPGKFLGVRAAVVGPYAHGAKKETRLIHKGSLQVNGCDAESAGVQAADG